MIRPEVRDLFWRWREVIAALGLAGFGLWVASSTFGITEWIGWGVFGLGMALALSAYQRVQFRGRGDGPGVVVVDERRVTYLGPQDGGVMDLGLLVQLDLTPSDAWRLIDETGQSVDIPVNAKGVDQLFDAFTALPGLSTEHMLSVMARRRRGPMTVWLAPDHKPFTPLH